MLETLDKHWFSFTIVYCPSAQLLAQSCGSRLAIHQWRKLRSRPHCTTPAWFLSGVHLPPLARIFSTAQSTGDNSCAVSYLEEHRKRVIGRSEWAVQSTLDFTPAPFTLGQSARISFRWHPEGRHLATALRLCNPLPQSPVVQ